MTRINVGIDPSELCDQMLIAEIHELPRVFKFRDDAGPEQFTLGKGHVLWCARYHASLLSRYSRLLHEASSCRNFIMSTSIDFHTIRAKNNSIWTYADEAVARPLLQDRINDRLSKMKRIPSWRNISTQPTWVNPTWIKL